MKNSQQSLQLEELYAFIKLVFELPEYTLMVSIAQKTPVKPRDVATSTKSAVS